LFESLFGLLKLTHGVGNIGTVNDGVALKHGTGFFHPPIFMITPSAIPARRRLRAAVLRRSWKISPLYFERFVMHL